MTSDSTGWKIWQPKSEEEMGRLYMGCPIADVLPFSLAENEYLLVADEEGKIVDKRCYQGGVLRSLKYGKAENLFTGAIKPRNDYQALAMDMLADTKTKVKIIRGVYGSGKDYLMLANALYAVKKERFSKIVYIRPNVTVKGLPDIGALPGTANEKLSWTLGPMLDKVGGESGVDMLQRDGQLEIIPLLYIRGRSFENSIIYVSEGQNMTTEIAKLIIGRVGEGSELWINGDTHQSDKSIFDTDNGINKMVDKLTGNKLFAYVYLPITERSEVANLANLLDED